MDISEAAALISLEQDVQEKFNKLFGQSGAGESEGASGGGEGGQVTQPRGWEALLPFLFFFEFDDIVRIDK